MKKAILIVISSFLFIGCTGKDLKTYGGNLATSGGGNPIMAGAGLLVGGTLYGVGSLLDDEETQENTEQIEQENINEKDENEKLD